MYLRTHTVLRACVFHLHKWCRVIAVTLFHSVVIHRYVLMSCPCCCVIIWSVCVSTTSCLSLIWWWTHRHWFLPPDTSNNAEWNSCACPHMVYVRISLGFRHGSRISCHGLCLWLMEPSTTRLIFSVSAPLTFPQQCLGFWFYLLMC